MAAVMYASCRLLVASENSPHAIMEPLFAGVPVVTFDVGTASQLVSDFSRGFVLGKPRVQEEFAHKVDIILSDPQLQRRMAEEAKRFVAQFYTWRVCAVNPGHVPHHAATVTRHAYPSCDSRLLPRHSLGRPNQSCLPERQGAGPAGAPVTVYCTNLLDKRKQIPPVHLSEKWMACVSSTSIPGIYPGGGGPGSLAADLPAYLNENAGVRRCTLMDIEAR